MVARLLSNLVFWLLMTVLTVGAALVVVFVYIPLVILKALYLTLTGRLGETTGLGNKRELGDQGRVTNT